MISSSLSHPPYHCSHSHAVASSSPSGAVIRAGAATETTMGHIMGHGHGSRLGWNAGAKLTLPKQVRQNSRRKPKSNSNNHH